MKINYSFFTANGVELHIAEPNTDENNRNQYLISFNGLKSFRPYTATIGIIGDWEYESFLECLKMAQEYIEGGATSERKTFKIKSMPIVELELLKKKDNPGKIRFKFTFFDQIPMINAASWKNCGKGVFSFYVSPYELEGIGEIIAKLTSLEYNQEEMLESSRGDWICPTEIFAIYNKTENHYAATCAKKHVEKVSPEGVSKAWLSIFDSLIDPESKIIECPNCKGMFLKDYYWKKLCVGCYKEDIPTGIKKHDLTKIKISEWLYEII